MLEKVKELTELLEDILRNNKLQSLRSVIKREIRALYKSLPFIKASFYAVLFYLYTKNKLIK